MRCAVVGDPVAHSLSPVLHAAAYAELGLDGDYTAHRVPAGSLADFVGALDARWRGLSVTMPLKREALALADVVAPGALLAGGVNTLVLDGPEGRVGHNTDVPGAVAAMTERGVVPRSVSVLGGGATAASLALAACDLGADRVRLLVREPARAVAAAAAVRAHPDAPAVEVGPLLPTGVTGDLVISTVPADAQRGDLVEACLASTPTVFEALYDPWPTPLAAAAATAGATVVSGLDLLVHQAALQLALFTGSTGSTGSTGATRVTGPLRAMRAAGEAALAVRRG